MDTDCLFGLVLSDPEFEGLLPGLTHYGAQQAVAEAMKVLYTALAPNPQVQCTGKMSVHASSTILYSTILYHTLPYFTILYSTILYHPLLNHTLPYFTILYHTLQEGVARLDLSPEGCLVVALLQQWLVRHLCKRLMQLMTSEAFTLHRNTLPSSYLENYISFHTHFSLQELIIKHHQSLEYGRG